jgi:uncharacterized protein YgbK (DUF1537 family)
MYIVLADDLTGAMDTGIQFRKYGIQTSVIVSADDCELRGDSCAGAVSINNSSRELSGSEAYEKTLRAVHRLSLSPQDILYKKIDSMMRGNPVQEIDAALEASGCRKAIVTPSFPQEGRIVREGVLHLPDGSSQDLLQRWHRESRFPVRPIAKEMLQDTATVRDMLFSPQTEVALFDAEDQETLRRIADVCRDIPGILYCGSAGLARELPVPQDDAPKSAPWNGVGKIFVVTGSMKMETAAQIRQLSQKGFQIVPLRVAALNRAEDKAEEISNACRATAAALHGDGPGVVLTFDYLLHAASKGEAAESETTPEQRKAALHLAGSLGAVVRAQDDRL